MADTIEDVEMEPQDIEQETPPDNVFIAPSIYKIDILEGKSYSHFSPIPQHIANDMSTECVLGVDEAGRGPVLGIQSHDLHLCTKAHSRHRSNGIRPFLLASPAAPLPTR